MNLSSIMNRLKTLGISKEKSFSPLFETFRNPDKKSCGFWTLERMLDHCEKHPDEGVCITLGCPLIPETEWMHLGSRGTVDGEEVEATEPLPRTKQPECSKCEHFGQAGERPGIYICR